MTLPVPECQYSRTLLAILVMPMYRLIASASALMKVFAQVGHRASAPDGPGGHREVLILRRRLLQRAFAPPRQGAYPIVDGVEALHVQQRCRYEFRRERHGTLKRARAWMFHKRVQNLQCGRVIHRPDH